MPLADRKKRIAGLPAKRRVGIVLSDHTDEDGTMLFLQACKLGLDPGKRDELDLDEQVGPNFPLRYKPTPHARPLRVVKQPAAPDWVHGIKHDGYRLQLAMTGASAIRRSHARRPLSGAHRSPSMARPWSAVSSESERVPDVRRSELESGWIRGETARCCTTSCRSRA
jgi:hypothetical protein